MTADRRAALVERVAEIMCCESPCQHPDGDTCCAAGYHAQATTAIDLIRNETLEEAASRVEGLSMIVGIPGLPYERHRNSHEYAAAIRALKGDT